ncbi:uncharacterized protein BXIN_1058 [Babesia sp. Xinjiang]|uniref:uncharacterized protein n=1 Tax=Babesia sp. Xinjiang TaxID=462227 RepID=UPI000A2373DF|nr:uncharacterized protein BXIN_1058 [Babesia sp. Xinjiang]ORM41988.1 hypothetical protein BXIN_1058 [Babesia sp. Xinjiang]
MSRFRILLLGGISHLLLYSYAVCSPLGSAINSIFLHINNVTVDCSEHSGRKIPYQDALIECAHDGQCCYVVVEEVDAHAEGPGLSLLCTSCELRNARTVKDARISIKGDQILGNTAKAFDISWNRQGICEHEQLLGELSSVESFTAAARECERKKCDYFTMSTLEGIVGVPGTANKAWFCSGSPKNVHADGFITATRKRRQYEF